MKPLSFEKSKKKKRQVKSPQLAMSWKITVVNSLHTLIKFSRKKGRYKGKKCAFKILKKEEPDKKREREIWKSC